MRRAVIGLLAASTLVAAASPILAQDAPLVADARCMIIYSLLGTQKDYEAASTLGSVYFFGKINGYGGGPKLEEELLRQLTLMAPEDIRTEAVRCGNEMVQQGEALSSLGARIKNHASQLNP